MRFFALGALFAVIATSARAGEIEVTGIKAVCRNGQVFVTWKDVAEGEAGAKYRYSVYRSDGPITQANVGKAEAVIRGIHNNSCKTPGMAYLQKKDRLDPAKPRLKLTADGEQLPLWSGVGVHTVAKDGKGYYAVVATDLELKPLSKVVPGKSATTKSVEEKVAPPQPIRQVPPRKGEISGEKIPKGLPLYVGMHGSCGSKARRNTFAYFSPKKEMGWRAGQPGGFSLSVREGVKTRILLAPRETLTTPAGATGVEGLWFGLWCKPNWATDPEFRAYPISEKRVKWLVDWAVKTYRADPNRVATGGQSMGAYGSMKIGLRRPRMFSAIYPTGPRCRMGKLSGISADGKKLKLYLTGGVPRTEKKIKPSCLRAMGGKRPMLPDGKTEYWDYLDAVALIERNHDDLPFLCFIGGRNNGKMWGGVGPWGDQVPTVKALLKNRHGFAFGWDNGTHGSAKKQFKLLCKYYPWHRFALNLSYPAFSGSSMDDDIGPAGPKEGYINLGFIWTDPVEDANKWESTISNAEAKVDITVDVTPRRCQKFKLKPGEKLKWANSAGGKGTVTADKWGLVTVEKVKIPLGKKVTLSITR